ncbi:hypothetical protein SLS58_001684 [Diplodia intermedia]|uniref:Uncharacterized protein n=1 Tax=Diplodia intermedia TaxID=856260 RepID=A0ABR3U1J6_9PEZI
MAPYPNSSYTITFDAPALKCDPLSTAILDHSINPKKPELLQEGWDTLIDKTLRSLAPDAQPLYIANASGFLSIHNHIFVYAGGSNFSCHLWNTSYTVDLKFSDGIQSTSISGLEYRHATNIASGEVLSHNHQPEIAYWSIFNALSGLLETQVIFNGADGTLTGADTDIFKSGIPACPGIVETLERQGVNKCVDPCMCRAKSIPAAIEDLSHNVSLSLMSSTLFSAATAATVDMAVSHPQNYYAYNRHGLLCAYAAAAAAAAACVAVGVHSYRANGYSAGSSFSTIVFTTRSPDLDRLAGGRCLGAQPVPDEARRTVLRYGLLRREGGEGRAHTAFGLADGVATLTKGHVCY